jgi:hypothetical protein
MQTITYKSPRESLTKMINVNQIAGYKTAYNKKFHFAKPVINSPKIKLRN